MKTRGAIEVGDKLASIVCRVAACSNPPILTFIGQSSRDLPKLIQRNRDRNISTGTVSLSFGLYKANTCTAPAARRRPPVRKQLTSATRLVLITVI
ncbi:hypothetical protein EVAR_91586_1 [Eumeta japonica]|uniref:Uncharacterized protein n=1 Tax=Eumeta variegata TaxID=151549 RepID=A0A4C1UWM6_EUMVA|nr:hypothetical protein EVAR_91586_1 [Eumeta japonica]